jgi:hypothetical protein
VRDIFDAWHAYNEARRATKAAQAREKEAREAFDSLCEIESRLEVGASVQFAGDAYTVDGFELQEDRILVRLRHPSWGTLLVKPQALR